MSLAYITIGKPPPKGLMKINFDATVCTSKLVSGMIGRDEFGQHLCSVTIRGPPLSPIETEASTFIKGLNTA